MNSSNPSSGVSVSVSPPDRNGQGAGATAFSRSYSDGTMVTLTAAGTAGTNTFAGWSGCDQSAGSTCTLTTNADKSVTATYAVPAVLRTLTVSSANPASGVAITVSPTDRNNQSNGSTSFTRSYADGTIVTLTAPVMVTSNLSAWTGCDSTFAATCSVVMSSDRTVQANYQSAPPPFTPQSGWWWDPKLNGTGFFIEYGGKSGNGMFVGGFLYDASGNNTWLVSTGPFTLATSTYISTWLKVTGGQTLTGPYQAPSQTTVVANVTIAFSDSVNAVMTRPDGTQINLVRLSFSQIPIPAPVAGAPQSGWWWAGSAFSGTGYGIEIQGNAVFIVAYVYDQAGNPMWYLATGALSSPNSYSGTWNVYAGGPQLTSPELPGCTPGTSSVAGVCWAGTPDNSSAVALTLAFSDATHGTLTMGNVVVPIVRLQEF